MISALQVRPCRREWCDTLTPVMTQGRITKLSDVPVLAPFFFVKPDYSSAEAKKMYHSFPSADYRTSTLLYPSRRAAPNAASSTEKVIDSLVTRLEGMQGSWDAASLSAVLHDENAKMGLKQKEYMTILRHRLTGMKVRCVHGVIESLPSDDWERLVLALQIRCMHSAMSLASRG